MISSGMYRVHQGRISPLLGEVKLLIKRATPGEAVCTMCAAQLVRWPAALHYAWEADPTAC
jgi:hypothetical protein